MQIPFLIVMKKGVICNHFPHQIPTLFNSVPFINRNIRRHKKHLSVIPMNDVRDVGYDRPCIYVQASLLRFEVEWELRLNFILEVHILISEVIAGTNRIGTVQELHRFIQLAQPEIAGCAIVDH